MVIGIALNDVLREFSGQLETTCNRYFKYGKPESERYSLEKNTMTEYDMVKYFDFESKKEYYKFLYEEASLEIFGHAQEMSEGLMRQFNEFIMNIKDSEEHEIVLVSREVGFAIPSTYFFLSKTICKIEKINFSQEFEDQWDGIDVLISANPITLESKPDGKISVKINTPYNTNVKCDYEFDRAEELFIDEENINKITKPNTEKEWIVLK